MTDYSKHIKVASLSIAALWILAVLFQLLDGDYSVSRLAFNLALGCAYLGYFISPDKSLSSANGPEGGDAPMPMIQTVLYGFAVLLGLVGILSSDIVGMI